MQQRPASNLPTQKLQPAGTASASVSATTVVEAVEVAPAPKRSKKRKLPENKLPEKVAHVIPESVLFNKLVEVEKRLDNIIKRRKADVHDQTNLPTYNKRVLRLYLFNSYANQDKKDKHAEEKPSWTFVLHGRVVEPDAVEEPEPQPPASGTAPKPAAPKAVASFASYIKSLTILLDHTKCSGGRHVLLWEKAKHTGDFSDSFEVKRLGSEECTVKVQLEVDWQPCRYVMPDKLAELLGWQYETRAKILQGLWLYIKANRLLNMQDPAGPTVNCDAKLKAIFGDAPLRMAAISERLSPLLSTMKPLELEYKIKLNGTNPSHPECIDVELEEPAVLRQPLSKSIDMSTREREVDALDQKIMANISKINEHRRRRAFFLGFSQSPVDFINALIASQARDLRIAKLSMTGKEYELQRRTAAFADKWIEDAIMKYLHRKLASGH